MNNEELKEKVVDYASKVFFYCVKRCNNRMDAEDLSQIILLEIIQNINKGARIDNLDYYVWGVCKNQYNMYLRKTIKDRKSIEYLNNIDDDSKTTFDEMLEDERIKKLNQGIKLLSKDYAEILYAYYVEDKTLKFIACELNMPLGTVKWKLAEIRKKLKEYLDMEKLNGKKAYVPKSFCSVQSFSGKMSFDAHDYVDSLLIKNLLYHSYGTECSIEDFSIELGISRPYIEEYVNKLVDKDCLLKLDNGKYLSNIAFINKKERREILDYVRDNIDNYYNLLKNFCLNNLDYYKSLFLDNNIKDEYLLWSLLFIVMINVELKFAKEFTLRKDGNNWDLMLLEDVDKLYPDEFFISFNGNGNDNFGIIAFPANIGKEDGKVSNVINYNKSLNGKEDVNLLNEIINLNKKYSDFIGKEKEKINSYIDNGYVDLVGDEVKVNIPIIKWDKYKELRSKVLNDKELINAYSELYNGVSDRVKDLIPSYLVNQTSFIIQSVVLDRSLIISKAFNEGIIKDDKTRKHFIYNGIIYK